MAGASPAMSMIGISATVGTAYSAAIRQAGATASGAR
ncbi:hypothetical protein J2S22_003249 [Rhodoplanes tepidamans]|nr:hypothetical protein [Rhodoplanes tepidamans]